MYWRQIVLFLGVCIALPTFLKGREREWRGQIFDREALTHASNFCLDMSNLDAEDSSIVKAFLEMESRPQKLLSKLPWKFNSDCGKADFVARIYFKQGTLNRPGGMSGGAYGGTSGGVYNGVKSSDSSEPSFQPVLLIYGQASIQLIYRTEGRKRGQKGKELLTGPFSNLLADLKTLRN